MVTIDDKVKWIRGQQFSIVENGLDETEVSAFVGRLIDQNNDLANKLEHLHSLTKLAEQTVVEAEEQAKDIKIEIEKQARAEAERIIAEAQQRAKLSAQEKVSLAEKQAQDILKEATEKAEVEAQRVRQEAEQLLLRSKKLGAEEIRQRFERFCEELLLHSEDAEQSTAISTEGDNKAPGSSGSKAAVCVQAETVAKEMQEEFSLGHEERDKKESRALYHGTVELAIPPPISLEQILKLHKHLTKTRQIKVLDVQGSAGSGIRIKLLLRTHIPLLSFLEALPEVEKVSDGLKEADKMYPPQHRGDEPPIIRVVVTSKK